MKPSNKIHWEVGRTKDLSAPLYFVEFWWRWASCIRAEFWR